MLARATEIEGHPDNVAAAIYGGFVDLRRRGGGAEAARFDPPDGLEGIVVIPPEEVSTERAREAIPAEIPLADAVANVSAASGSCSACAAPTSTWSPAAWRTASTSRAAASSTRARWSWSTRPRSWARSGRRSPAPGPTVLVWTTWQDAGKVAAALEERCAGWAEVRRLPFTPLGADVPEL